MMPTDRIVVNQHMKEMHDAAAQERTAKRLAKARGWSGLSSFRFDMTLLSFIEFQVSLSIGRKSLS